MNSFAKGLEDDGMEEYEEYIEPEKSNDSDVDNDNDIDDVDATNINDVVDTDITPTPINENKKSKKIMVDLSHAYNEVLDLIDEFEKKDDDIQYVSGNPELLPWVEKYRPKTLNDVISHETIIATLKQFIKNNYFPHMLLSGPPGTGKTSAIMACARELYKDNYSLMVLDINASEERGIEVVRNKIKDFICTKGIFLKDKASAFKLVILDEADAMTSDAQAMLVSFMEHYSVNVRFCLICNYIKKICPAIQSRCTVFKFSPLNKLDITKKIKEVCESSKTMITNDGIETLIKTSKGDMRKVLNTLQVTNMSHEIINSDSITTCIGYPTPVHMDMIYNLLIHKSYGECANEITSIVEQNGYALSDIVTELTCITTNNFLNNIIPQDKYMKILITMRNIETNLTLCPNESIQLLGLIGLFKLTF